MSAPNSTGDLQLTPWQVGDFRLTAFPSMGTPAGGAAKGKQWEELVGQKPETAVSRNFDTEAEETGPFGPAGRLSYVRSPRGIQWMLERLRDPKKAGAAFLGPDVLVSFKELMCRWLVDCPPFQRLAFGAALYLPVKDRREGYRELKNRLKFGPEHEEKEGDFLYQYNRRRTSLTVPELEINRLSKWTWVPLGEVYVKDGKLIHPPESACLLELDINTMPEFQGTLPHDRCAPLFEEMVKLAVEIAQRGDVP
jgi:hypothetical protein